MQPVDQLPNSILSLSGQTADKLLALGDGNAALVYLSLLRRGNASALKWDAARLQTAMDRLAAAGLISSAQARPAADPAGQVDEHGALGGGAEVIGRELTRET